MSQRPRTEIEADLAAARAARSALISGNVTEVTRDGRSMKFAHLKLSDLNSMIADLIAELDALPEFDGGPRRRTRSAISLSWNN